MRNRKIGFRLKTFWRRRKPEEGAAQGTEIKSGKWWNKLARFLTKVALWMYYNPILQVLFIVGLFVGINILAMQLFYRLDATRYRSYTFSPVMQKTVKALPEKLTVKLFLSSDLPAGIDNIPSEIKDYFIELQRLNPDKVTLEYYDPSTVSADVNLATEYNINKIQYADPQGNRATVGNAYLGVGFSYKDQQDSIGEVRNSSDLELQTLLVLRRFTLTDKPAIGFVGGHGELDLTAEYPELFNWLQAQFTTEAVNLAELKDLNRYKALVLIAPSQNYPEKELFALDQYILNGGKVLFIMERHTLTDGQQAQLVSTNVFDLLQSYGVGNEKGMAMDKSYNPFYAQGLPLEYPFWLRIPAEYLNTDSGVLRDIQSVNLAWATTFKPELARYEGKPQPTLVPIIRTTEQGALAQGDTVLISLEQAFNYTNPGQRVLSYQVSGNVISHFAGHKNEKKLASNAKKDFGATYTHMANSDKANFIVIGDSDFMLDRSQFGLPSSVDVFLRMLYWSVNDQDMLTLKSPVVTIPWSRAASDQQIQWYKVGNFVGVGVLLLAVAGAYWWYTRRQYPRF